MESMQSMQQIITSQSESMAETQNIVKEVLGEIGNSMQSIRQIKARVPGDWKIPEMKLFRRVQNMPEFRKKMWKAQKKSTMEHGKLSNVPAGICLDAEQLREFLINW